MSEFTFAAGVVFLISVGVIGLIIVGFWLHMLMETIRERAWVWTVFSIALMAAAVSYVVFRVTK